MMERGDVSRNIFALVIVGDQTFVARAGKMDDLKRQFLERGHRLDHGLVDSGRALASAHHQQRRQIVAQPELLQRDFAIDALELSANRRAGKFRFYFREKLRAFLESEQTPRAPSARSCDSRFPGMAFDS